MHISIITKYSKYTVWTVIYLIDDVTIDILKCGEK